MAAFHILAWPQPGNCGQNHQTSSSLPLAASGEASNTVMAA